jgi:ATP-dependent Clp protease ATP-binding subunit ClpB
MNLNKYTQKAQDAVLEAQRVAEEQNHAQIEGLHLLASLLNQQDGVVPQIVNRVNANLAQLKEQVVGQLDKQPRAVGSTTRVVVSMELKNITRAAEREAAKMKDDFVSTEHLFLALVDASPSIYNLSFLQGAGFSHEIVLKALRDIRGGQRVPARIPSPPTML